MTKTHRWRLGPLLEAIFVCCPKARLNNKISFMSYTSRLLVLVISISYLASTCEGWILTPSSPTYSFSLRAGGWGKKSKDYSEAELAGKDSTIPSRPVEDYTLQQPRDFYKRIQEDKKKVRVELRLRVTVLHVH